MFNYLKDLKYNIENSKFHTIELDTLKKGVNTLDDYIIVKTDQISVYDRVCNHMGGKIISKDSLHICPMHNWKFNPTKGIYSNGVKKNKMKFTLDKKLIKIEKRDICPSISKSSKNSPIKIRFFNHAFLQVETEDFKFATDPWAIGPAFNTGWWLKKETKFDWIKELNSCSFIYISHNHPDHLHPLTLSKVNKDIPIVVPKFASDSTGNYIESLGFGNIVRLDFSKEYQFKDTNLILSLLKSGDFREDSGIYFSIGNFTSLFDVDSNLINFNRLPKVDLYGSAFAGGAGGYPLMFDNFTKKQKLEIAKKDLRFGKIKKNEMIKNINPSYFLPYAGFFDEKLSRDKEIKKNNIKNKIEDYQKICTKFDTILLNVNNFDEFYFEENKLKTQKKNKSKNYKDIAPKEYLKFYKKNYSNIDENYIKKYFEESKFNDNLVLFISLTNDNFSKSYFDFKVDFSLNKIKYKIVETIDPKKFKNNNEKKVLYLKCRKESFLNTIYNKQPWEDLSIGFQAKFLRYPNEYNVDFWHHFTNNYITKKNIRFSSKCNSCEVLSTYVDNEMYVNKV